MRRVPELPRETVEYVIANQAEVRSVLLRLAQEDRPLKPEERESFLLAWERGTLGLGAFHHLGGSIPGVSRKTLDGAVWLLYSGKRTVRCRWEGDAREEEVTAGELARLILKRCQEEVFGKALQYAMRYTPETGGGDIARGIRPRFM